MATVTSKGQITLPKWVREALGLRPGSQIEFEAGPDGIVLRKRIPDAVFDRWQGYLRDRMPGVTTDEWMVELRGE